MNINRIDAGNYFRGLLLLIRKDGIISESEVELMKRVGKGLGFETRFCEDAIHEILENSFILDEPPRFSTNELAMKFITDSLTLASSDQVIHPAEVNWLRKTAETNAIDPVWFLQELGRTRHRGAPRPPLEVEQLTVTNT